ncbi:MAG: hypothetical protein DIZ80_14840 [endosymbiont of Galathealinum brachiosum]|uniref:DUF72 domain-containing protein n=1 Tax=endosymbiont of Galathealinum brachiosum TaxID=2200906 RepID=A0A370D8X9_9GAMM|nr:MAG: hypothetical protein DIZ80_14840 [endosymbiont of Galathealinum brachiosum]
MIHDKTIRVGACDWDHAHWQGSFYPDDLPVDWRLTYYANEYSAVLVPESKWRSKEADFEQWADDVPEGFRFYFLTSRADEEDGSVVSLVNIYLGDMFAGFVQPEGNDQVDLIHFESKSLREWKGWLQEADSKVVFLTDENPGIKQLSEFQSLVQLMGL